MTRTHATGSGITYGKRYLLNMIFDIVTLDKALDDDGRAAGKVAEGVVTPEQLEALMSKIASVACPIQSFCSFAKIENVADLPSKDFDRAIKALDDYERKQTAEKK